MDGIGFEQTSDRENRVSKIEPGPVSRRIVPFVRSSGSLSLVQTFWFNLHRGWCFHHIRTASSVYGGKESIPKIEASNWLNWPHNRSFSQLEAYFGKFNAKLPPKALEATGNYSRSRSEQLLKSWFFWRSFQNLGFLTKSWFFEEPTGNFQMSIPTLPVSGHYSIH